MIREGMTLEQYDYLESNASLSTATSIAITQLARTAMQKVRQRAVEKQVNAAKNVGTEAAGEGNNESTNKANAAKPDVQQGTAEGETNVPGGKGKSIKFGSNVKSSDKLNRQMTNRGWTQDSVRDTVDNAYTTRKAVNKATGNTATVYYNKDGSHVIIDDITNEVVQVSDKFEPNWIPDQSIINPYNP